MYYCTVLHPLPSHPYILSRVQAGPSRPCSRLPFFSPDLLPAAEAEDRHIPHSTSGGGDRVRPILGFPTFSSARPQTTPPTPPSPHFFFPFPISPVPKRGSPLRLLFGLVSRHSLPRRRSGLHPQSSELFFSPPTSTPKALIPFPFHPLMDPLLCCLARGRPFGQTGPGFSQGRRTHEGKKGKRDLLSSPSSYLTTSGQKKVCCTKVLRGSSFNSPSQDTPFA